MKMYSIPKSIQYTDESKSRDTPTFILLNKVIFVGDFGVVEVPAGFSTDFGSVPRFARSIIPNQGYYDPAFVLHDYMYFDGTIVSRKEADKILKNNIMEIGNSIFDSNVIYFACRIGGASHWRTK